jgi:hypothetical protein
MSRVIKSMFMCSYCHKEFSKDQYYQEHMSKKTPCCFESELTMKLKEKHILNTQMSASIPDFSLKLDILKKMIENGSEINSQSFNIAINGCSLSHHDDEHPPGCRCVSTYKTEYNLLTNYLSSENEMKLFDISE